MNSLLQKRILTGLILFGLVAFLIWQGGLWIAGGILVIVLLALWEYGALMKKLLEGVDTWILFPPGIGIIGAVTWRVETGEDYLPVVLFLGLLLILIFNIKRGPAGYFLRVALLVFGLFYIPFTLSHALLLRGGVAISSFNPWHLIWAPLLVTWVTDIAAFFIGSTWGKTPLSPAISPKKSVEGALGGGILGIGVLLILALILQWPLLPFLVLGILMVITGQLGDLVESCIKRNAGAKDSGNILPGHGGFLDRIDSVIINLPLAYYFMVFFL